MTRTTFRKVTHTTFAVEHDGVYLGECKRKDGGRYWLAKGLFAPIGDLAAGREIAMVTAADLGNTSEAKASIAAWLEAHDHLIRRG